MLPLFLLGFEINVGNDRIGHRKADQKISNSSLTEFRYGPLLRQVITSKNAGLSRRRNLLSFKSMSLGKNSFKL